MKKFDTRVNKKDEICKECTNVCKNKDGSALVQCDDYINIKEK